MGQFSIFRKDFWNFVKRVETILFFLFITSLSVTVIYLPEDKLHSVFLLSITTSLWAALFFYIIFNIYSLAQEKHENLLTFRDMMKRKIKYFESVFQNFINEAEEHNPQNEGDEFKGFFKHVERLGQNHTCTTSGLRMIVRSYVEDNQLKHQYATIQDACIYHFDRSIKNFNEIERLALSLQLRHLDPDLYEKIYSLIDCKPLSRNIVRTTPSRNPHCALASDLGVLSSRLKSVIKHLNEEWKMDLSIRDDID
jgi:hypothetical protein